MHEKNYNSAFTHEKDYSGRKLGTFSLERKLLFTEFLLRMFILWSIFQGLSIVRQSAYVDRELSTTSWFNYDMTVLIVLIFFFLLSLGNYIFGQRWIFSSEKSWQMFYLSKWQGNSPWAEPKPYFQLFDWGLLL